MMATSINDVILLAGLPAMKVVRCTLEAEWLYNRCDKCNAQILKRPSGKVGDAHGQGCLLLPMCYVFLHLHKNTSHEHKLFVVTKIHKMRDTCTLLLLG
jgi:hypothetical protein